MLVELNTLKKAYENDRVCRWRRALSLFLLHLIKLTNYTGQNFS